MSGGPVFKILIDLDEYLKLLTLKEVVKKQEEEIKKHYATSSLNQKALTFDHKEKLPSVSNAENLTATKDEKKIGAGVTPPSFNKADLIREITAEVTKTIEHYYNLKPVNSAVAQEGSGADDLIDSDPVPITNTVPIPLFQPVEHVEIKKSRLNDDFDIKKLLDIIPAENLEKAETLIKKLENFPNEITWDSAGTIFIDQKSLPESNIYDIFPKLFRKVANINKILHLKEVASKIASLGFGYLINSRLTSGLNRKKPLANFDELHTKTKTNLNWWYLGPE
jgi:hypothetical protein